MEKVIKHGEYEAEAEAEADIIPPCISNLGSRLLSAIYRFIHQTALSLVTLHWYLRSAIRHILCQRLIRSPTSTR